MKDGYMVCCFQCGRSWIIEDYDPIIGFACEYCMTMGKLNMEKISCKVLNAEQMFHHYLLKEGFAKVVDFD